MTPEPRPQNPFDQGDAYWWDGGKKVKPPTFEPRRLDTPLDKMMRRNAGRRSRTYSDRKRGRYIMARPAMGRKPDDLAFDATLRAAAPSSARRADLKQPAPGGLCRAARRLPAQGARAPRGQPGAVPGGCLLVDGGGRAHVATKGAILSLLTDAYQRRDRVGLITFQKDRSLLILPPTNSVLLAERALRDIPVGGKTPLSAGLQMAYDVLRREKMLHPDVLPLLIILTDGAGNVSMGQPAAAGRSPPIAE
jgi:magnesium chelatase subunit ChlD-like protein